MKKSSLFVTIKLALFQASDGQLDIHGQVINYHKYGIGIRWTLNLEFGGSSPDTYVEHAFGGDGAIEQTEYFRLSSPRATHLNTN